MGWRDWLGLKSAERRATAQPTDVAWQYVSTTDADLAATRYSVKRDQAEMILRCAGYVNICASIFSDFAASVPIRHMRKVGKGQKTPWGCKRLTRTQRVKMRAPIFGKAAQHADMDDDVVEVLDSPFLQLLQKPNDEDTGVEFRRLHFYLQPIAGNCYWLKLRGLKVRGLNGQPIYLRHLLPQHTTILAADPSTDAMVMGYGYGRNRAKVEVFAASDVAHFKHRPSPIDPFYGVGQLHGIVTEADTAAAAAQWELNLINNDQRPAFAVNLPIGSSEKVADQVKAFFKRRHRGVANVGEPLVGQNFTVTPLSFPPRDMQFVERNRAAIKAVCDGFGMCGMLDEETGSIQIGAGGLDAKETRYLRQTVAPALANFCEALTENIMPEFGYQPGTDWCTFDNPVPEDEKMLVELLDIQTKAGIVTLDEARAELNRDELPDGLGAIPRFNGQPLTLQAQTGFGGVPMMLPGGWGMGVPMNMPGSSSSGGTPMNLPGVSTASSSSRDSSGVPMMLPGSTPDSGSKTAVDASSHRHCCSSTGTFKQSRVWLEDWSGSSLSRKDRADASPFATREQMRDLINRVQAWVQSISPDVVGDQVQFDVQAVMERFANDAARPIRDTFGSGWIFGAAQIPEGADMTRTEGRTLAQQYADQHVIRLARPVTESVANRMNEILRGVIDTGIRGPEAAAMVQDAMGGEAYYIADRIARTELANAYQHGQIQAWEQSGAVIGKRFVLAAGACQLCQEVARQLEGKVIPLGQPTVPRGTTISAGGRTQVFDFADVQTGITHPNCRCSVEPVMEGEQ